MSILALGGVYNEPNLNFRRQKVHVQESKHSQRKLNSADSSSTQFSERQKKREYISDTDTGDSGEF